MNQRTGNKLEEIFGIDLRSLALMRICFGLIVIADLFYRIPCISVFYTDDGVMPAAYAARFIAHWPILFPFISGGQEVQLAFFLLLGLCAGCVLVGYRTTLFTVLTWFLLRSMHIRNMFIVYGGSALIQDIFFWCMFLPWGKCWSIDRLREGPKDYPQRAFSMATAAYLFQIALLYLFAGSSKIVNDYTAWVRDGTALYYALHMDEVAKPCSHFLLYHPFLLKALTYSSWLLECGGSLLLFLPWGTDFLRMAILAAFMIFHTGILLTLETGFFQLTAMAALLGFLPGTFWNKILPSARVRQATEAVSAPAKNPFALPGYLTVFLAVLMVYIFFVSLADFPSEPFMIIPRPLRVVQYNMGITEHWNMFSPLGRLNEWLVVAAKLRDGRTVDTLRKGKPVSWDRPLSNADLYGNYLWGKYYFNIHSSMYHAYLLPYSRYVCKSWNSTHPMLERIISLNVVYVKELIRPDNQRAPPMPKVLWSQKC